MSENRNAEQAAGQTATEGFAIYCHQEALRTWREPRHQQALYVRLVEDGNLRSAFAAGVASRQEEVDHFRDEMVNFYKETVALREALRRIRYLWRDTVSPPIQLANDAVAIAAEALEA